MTIKKFCRILWNGGLDPKTADPSQFRRRRTLTATWLCLIAVGLLMMVTNITLVNAPDENIEVGAVVLVALAGLYFQAFKGWERFASLSMVFIFWLAPFSVMYRSGISSANWTWLLPAVLLANLLAGRFVAIVFTCVSVVSLITLVVMTNNGTIAHGLILDDHAISVGIVGSMGLTIMAILGFTFRTFQDSTEQNLRSTLASLEQEVKIRRAAEKSALAAQKVKTTFLTTISHELRTPLNGVIGAGQLLTDTPLYQNERVLIDTVNQSGDILIDLINNVLDLSRLEAGRLELEKEAINPTAEVNATIAALKICSEKKGLELHCQIDDNVPEFVIGDATRIRQILLNLCGNAIKFTNHGKIELQVTYHNENLYLNVIDTGIGIAEDKIEKLFKPFTRGENNTTEPPVGTGLGLSITAQLVELFGGKITLRSRPGQGSHFTVTLPLSASENHNTNSEEQSIEQTFAPLETSLTVLLTDDNLVNRKVASQMLERLGCGVVEAVDGCEAISAIQANSIDVVLMDVNMPTMDGLTATSHIRQLGKPYCDTPIIGFSANSNPADQDNLLAAGMNSTLPKPVRMEDLRRALEKSTTLL